MPADVTLEKTLPHNLEAERSILGAILLDDKAIYPVLELLRLEDFYLEGHRRIFAKMIALTQRSHPIDLVTLKDELQRAGELELAGGPAYLAGLTDGLPRAVNVEHYARIVREKAVLRRLIRLTADRARRIPLYSPSAPEPMGVTAPIPVTTTRRMALPPGRRGHGL